MEPPGNIQRLSSELDELGIVDQRMSFYMPLRLREQQRDGYSGFEARYYSLFPSYDRDMAPAASLQQFLLALSYRLALQGEVTHEADSRRSHFRERAPPAILLFRRWSAGILRASRLAQPVPARILLRTARRRAPAAAILVISGSRCAIIAGRCWLTSSETAGDLVEAMNMQATLADLGRPLR